MRTPHTVTLYPQDEVLAGSLIVGYVDGEPVDVACQITPLDAKDVYDQFGEEVKEAWLLMGNLGTQDLFAVGARVDFKGRRFAVKSPAHVFQDFGNADHFSLALEAVEN